MGFSNTEYREIADILMPEIYKHVAGLYKLFWGKHPDLTASAVVGSSYTQDKRVQIPVTVTRSASNLTQYVRARKTLLVYELYLGLR